MTIKVHADGPLGWRCVAACTEGSCISTVLAACGREGEQHVCGRALSWEGASYETKLKVSKLSRERAEVKGWSEENWLPLAQEAVHMEGPRCVQPPSEAEGNTFPNQSVFSNTCVRNLFVQGSILT